MSFQEEREHLRCQLQDIGQGVLQEWMRLIEIKTPDIALTGQARIRWQNNDGECIVGEGPYGDEYGRFRITVHAEDLGPMPPIDPENDLGVYGIVDERPGEPVSAGQDEELEHWGREMAEEQPIWVERPLQDVRPGDTIRIPGEPETEEKVETIRLGNSWHIKPGTERYNPQRMEWSQLHVTFVKPVTSCGCVADANGTGECGHVAYEVITFRDPEMPVEIQTTASELVAIEALGGWPNRIQVTG